MAFQLAQQRRIEGASIAALDVLPDVVGPPHANDNCAHRRMRQDIAQRHLR